MLHCLLYWPCRFRTRRPRSGSEWASASAATWLGRRSALTAITRTIRMVARPMATTVRVGSRTGSLSAPAPGTTAGDIHITAAALRDVVLSDATTDAAMRDAVRRFGAASKDAVRPQASAAGLAGAGNK